MRDLPSAIAQRFLRTGRCGVCDRPKDECATTTCSTAGYIRGLAAMPSPSGGPGGKTEP